DGTHHHGLEAVSHDGSKLVYGVTREENLDFVFRQPLFIYDTESKKETPLVDEEGYFGDAVFSHDDAYIAYVGSPRQYQNATHTELYVHTVSSGTSFCQTEGMDVPV